MYNIEVSVEKNKDPNDIKHNNWTYDILLHICGGANNKPTQPL